MRQHAPGVGDDRTSPSKRAQSWVDEGVALLEGVIASRGETDSYPYHVLGAQGLAWSRRSRSNDERRRLLGYFQNVLEQGLRKHPFRRDLIQLNADIKSDLLMTVTRPDSLS